MEIEALTDRENGATGASLWDRLMAHQREAVTWLVNHPRALLADEVGLGKTIVALALIDQLHLLDALPDRRDRVRAIVVTDASLVSQWAAEAALFVPHLRTATQVARAISPTNAEARARHWSTDHPAGLDLLIVGHNFASARNAQLDAYQPELVVVDEASALKGGLKIYAGVKSLTEPANRRAVAMTATPLETSPMELWYLLDAVRTPALWPEQRFSREFVEWEPGFTRPDGEEAPPKALGWLPGAADAVREYLCTVALRRTSEQAGLSLPTVAGSVHWVPLQPWQVEQYDSYAGQGGMWVANKREEISRRPCAKAVKSWLNRRPDVTKAIIYAYNHDRLDLLAELLGKAGIGYVRIDGSFKDVERTGALGRFRDDPEVRVLIGSRVLERGLNLQHCRVLLSLDSSWNPAREAQRAGRICRIGSPHATVEHVTFLGDTPVTRRKVAQLDNRRAMAEAVGL